MIELGWPFQIYQVPGSGNDDLLDAGHFGREQLDDPLNVRHVAIVRSGYR